MRRLACLAAAALSIVTATACPLVAAEPHPPADHAADHPPAIAPAAKIDLLADGNLDQFVTWLKESGYDDPKQVFRMTDDGWLHITGDGLGGIVTKQAYRDYHLVAEFRWGNKTWGTREQRTKDSGILVHCVGPEGNYNDTWMASFEAQVIEGGCGDFIVVAGKYADGSPVPMSLSAEVSQDRDGESVWTAGGEPRTFHRGRVNWFGRDPDWADVLGFRGARDVESPDGQWTRMEVICAGDTITNIVNGVKVNYGFDVWPASGKILIQTELAEVYYRKLELWPIGEAPHAPAIRAR